MRPFARAARACLNAEDATESPGSREACTGVPYCRSCAVSPQSHGVTDATGSTRRQQQADLQICMHPVVEAFMARRCQPRTVTAARTGTQGEPVMSSPKEHGAGGLAALSGEPWAT